MFKQHKIKQFNFCMLNWFGKCLLSFPSRLSPHPPSFSQSNMFETRKGKRGDGGWMEMEGKKKKGKEGSLAMTAKRRRIPLVFFFGESGVCVCVCVCVVRMQY